eukprot:975412-Amphidinium_carterae.1
MAEGLPAFSRGELTFSKQQLLENPPDEEAVAAAKQHDQVPDLRRKLLDNGACTCLEWPNFLGEIPPTVEAQRACRDAWLIGKKKKQQTERAASWRTYVKETWGRETAQKSTTGSKEAELNAWSKPWQPGHATFPSKSTSASSCRTGDLRKIIAHCRLGKARGVDRWSTGELRLLTDVAREDLVNFLKVVEATGTWPQDIREMMYLQLPKEGARDAGERRPIALLPQ